jgi:hypothetical protein
MTIRWSIRSLCYIGLGTLVGAISVAGAAKLVAETDTTLATTAQKNQGDNKFTGHIVKVTIEAK